MDNLFWTKMPKLYNGTRKTYSKTGDDLTGFRHVENANRSISITLRKTQVQVDKRPQYKTTYSQSGRYESGK